MDSGQELDHRLIKIEHELSVFGRRAERFRMAIADDSGTVLDRSAYLLLSHIHEHGAVRLTTLGTVFALDISTVSRQVAALAAAGLVERTTDPSDRRATLVKLSTRGQQRYLATRSARVEKINILIRTWGQEELSVFGALLGRLNVAIAEHDRSYLPPQHDEPCPAPATPPTAGTD
ncbi:MULTISPECIES: MarR family winged helix-turn-helix transcriptional regulator [Protofrankia]|uniref:Regulatory protein MarR n=1 Tax=Candidatus Protofrankia datiscae TaxID=2716812 RepID=F8AYN1_9ACTN|nr:MULTISPECIES: MarR family transcriptional regulator [Protofrankia]AEH11603.1 regulatory protein MarR [Candidatus Protofrankia datiscae]